MVWEVNFLKHLFSADLGMFFNDNVHGNLHDHSWLQELNYLSIIYNQYLFISWNEGGWWVEHHELQNIELAILQQHDINIDCQQTFFEAKVICISAEEQNQPNCANPFEIEICWWCACIRYSTLFSLEHEKSL